MSREGDFLIKMSEIKVFPVLYARAKTGKIKEWAVSVVGPEITVIHGQQGGKLTPQVTTIKEGKNIGKSNETTPHEQALLEAQSKWNKQVKKDYRESVEDIPTSTLPPLAKKYQDASEALGNSYDVLCKLNGVRCTLFYNNGDVIFQTRGGESYPVIKEIVDELYEEVWKDHPKMVVDIELYRHGMYLEDIVATVKKHNKDTPRIQAHVFDMFNPEDPDQIWEDRYADYMSLVGNDGIRVKSVRAVRVHSEATMKALHDTFVDNKFEGVVCRKLGSKFVFGHRTSDFQKYKVPLDAEYKVVRIDVDKNGCAVPWCYIDNQVDHKRCEFKAPLIGTREYQQEIAQNKENYIGKYLKVVFEGFSKYGVPTKTKGHVFREVDEDNNPME